MSKAINVDEFLNTNALTLTIGGKEHIVTDLPFETQKILSSAADLLTEGNSEELRKGVAIIVGCEESDLKKYGIKGLTYILEVVTSHFFPETPSQESQSDNSKEQG